MAVQRFHRTQADKNLSPAENYEVVTPADTDLAFITRRIRVGATAGNLVVKRPDGTQVTIAAGAFEQFDIEATQVKAATTAAEVLVMY